MRFYSIVPIYFGLLVLVNSSLGGCFKAKQPTKVSTANETNSSNGFSVQQEQELQIWDDHFLLLMNSFGEVRAVKPDTSKHVQLKLRIKETKEKIERIQDSKIRSVASYRFYAVLRFAKSISFVPTLLRQGDAIGTNSVNGVTTKIYSEIPWALLDSDDERLLQVAGVDNPLTKGGVEINNSESQATTIKNGFKFVYSSLDLQNLKSVNFRGSFDEAFLGKIIPNSTELSNDLISKLLFRGINDLEIIVMLKKNLTFEIQVEAANDIGFRGIKEPKIFALAAEVRSKSQLDALNSLLFKGERNLEELKKVFQIEAIPSQPSGPSQLPNTASQGIANNGCSKGLEKYQKEVKSSLSFSLSVTDPIVVTRVWNCVKNDSALEALKRLLFHGIKNTSTLELIGLIDSEIQSQAVTKFLFSVKNNAQFEEILRTVILNTKTEKSLKNLGSLPWENSSIFATISPQELAAKLL